MPLRLHHLAVVVRELAVAESFYCGVLGLPVIKRWDDAHGQPRSVWAELGQGAFLAIERAAAATPTRADEAPGLHCVALAIPPGDRETWRARLAQSGFPIEKETAFTLYVRDPDKNLVALSHYPDKATPPDKASA